MNSIKEKNPLLEELSEQDCETLRGGAKEYKAWIDSCRPDGYVVAIQNTKTGGVGRFLTSLGIANDFVKWFNKKWGW